MNRERSRWVQTAPSEAVAHEHGDARDGAIGVVFTETFHTGEPLVAVIEIVVSQNEAVLVGRSVFEAVGDGVGLPRAAFGVASGEQADVCQGTIARRS